MSKAKRSYEVRKVGDPRQRLADDELEGYRRQEEDEGQLKSVLRKGQIDGERGEREAADEQLQRTNICTPCHHNWVNNF